MSSGVYAPKASP
jgi:hypothetical protein